MTIDEAIKHAEEVAKELEEEAVKGCCDDTEIMNKCTECAKEHRQLAEWLRELKELREQIRWIPCSEMLPEDGTEVFVYLFDRPSPYIAWVEDTHWYTEDFEIERENEPIAWMPLPEPYRGGESEC